MSKNQEIIEKIYERFRNDAAGFSVALTNIFKEQDGKPQEIYPLQLEVLNHLKPEDKLIAIVKTRQCGISTSVKALSLHRAYFGKVPNILICSASQLQATKMLREIKEAVNSMPEFLRPTLTKESETEIHLKSGSKIISLPANPSTVRGFSADVILDEYAQLSKKDASELFEALFPSLLKGWQMIVISTPRGMDHPFYDMCHEDAPGYKANKVIRINWDQVPHVREAVLRDKLNEIMPVKAWMQEFCCAFVSDETDSFFSYEFINDKFIDKGLSFVDLSIVDGSKGDVVGESYICRDIISEFSNGVICGFDGNAGGEDGSICVAFGVNGEEWKMIALKMLPKGMEIDAQCDYYSRFCHFFNARKAGFDSTSGLGKAFEQKLRKTWAGKILYPFSFNNSSKLEEYTHLKNRIENHQMKAPEHSEMIKQFTVLGFNPVTKRIASMGSWRTNHDDIPSAIMVAHAARHKTNNSGFSFI